MVNEFNDIDIGCLQYTETVIPIELLIVLINSF